MCSNNEYDNLFAEIRLPICIFFPILYWNNFLDAYEYITGILVVSDYQIINL
jgi:hypothetical protein